MKWCTSAVNPFIETSLAQQGGQLGFRAPKRVPCGAHRYESYEKKKRERKLGRNAIGGVRFKCFKDDRSRVRREITGEGGKRDIVSLV